MEKIIGDRPITITFIVPEYGKMENSQTISTTVVK